MYQKLLALLCVCVFLAGTLGCTDKTPITKDHKGKIPSATSDDGGSSDKPGQKNGTQTITD